VGEDKKLAVAVEAAAVAAVLRPPFSPPPVRGDASGEGAKELTAELFAEESLEWLGERKGVPAPGMCAGAALG